MLMDFSPKVPLIFWEGRNDMNEFSLVPHITVTLVGWSIRLCTSWKSVLLLPHSTKKWQFHNHSTMIFFLNHHQHQQLFTFWSYGVILFLKEKSSYLCLLPPFLVSISINNLIITCAHAIFITVHPYSNKGLSLNHIVISVV